MTLLQYFMPQGAVSFVEKQLNFPQNLEESMFIFLFNLYFLLTTVVYNNIDIPKSNKIYNLPS